MSTSIFDLRTGKVEKSLYIPKGSSERAELDKLRERLIARGSKPEQLLEFDCQTGEIGNPRLWEGGKGSEIYWQVLSGSGSRNDSKPHLLGTFSCRQNAIDLAAQLQQIDAPRFRASQTQLRPLLVHQTGVTALPAFTYQARIVADEPDRLVDHYTARDVWIPSVDADGSRPNEGPDVMIEIEKPSSPVMPPSAKITVRGQDLAKCESAAEQAIEQAKEQLRAAFRIERTEHVQLHWVPATETAD